MTERDWIGLRNELSFLRVQYPGTLAASAEAARLLDDIAGCLRENLIQRAQYTPEVAEQFERFAQLSGALAACGAGQPIPRMLYERSSSGT